MAGAAGASLLQYTLFGVLMQCCGASQDALSAERELRARVERERDTALQRVSELEALLVEVRCIASSQQSSMLY